MLFENPETCTDDPVAVQVNKVPGTFEVSERLVGWELHCDLLFGVFDRSGVGYTVTT